MLYRPDGQVEVAGKVLAVLEGLEGLEAVDDEELPQADPGELLVEEGG